MERIEVEKLPVPKVECIEKMSQSAAELYRDVLIIDHIKVTTALEMVEARLGELTCHEVYEPFAPDCSRRPRAQGSH